MRFTIRLLYVFGDYRVKNVPTVIVYYYAIYYAFSKT